MIPTDDLDAVRGELRKFDRRATTAANPFLAAILKRDERQYLAPTHGCDCGTMLGSGPPPPQEQAQLDERTARRLSRKGWSEAKIRRSLHDRARAAVEHGGGVDSFTGWAEIARQLMRSLGVSHVGLFVHDYHGQIDTEVFQPRRVEAGNATNIADALSAMREDELYVFNSATS